MQFLRSVIFFLLIIPVKGFTQTGPYSRILFKASPQEQLVLQQSGVSLDHLHETAEGFIGEFSSEETAILTKLTASSEIVISDLGKNVLERNSINPSLKGEMYVTPAGFNYGSLGGFLTLEELLLELDSMQKSYPNLISGRDTIGYSIESRPILAYRISDNAKTNEEEPEVLFTGLHHAREPMSMTQMIYFMQYVLENYSTDPEIKLLIDGAELYFIPVVNPDGYLFNEEGYADGNIYWRKNRRDNQDGTIGVDLNRNYGHFWGLDDNGSSPNSSSDTYRGENGFSEPETQAIRNFCNTHQFKAALNYHSYSDVLIYPFGYSVDAITPDSTAYRLFGAQLTAENKYPYGNCYQSLGYLVNGTSDDWMYGEQTSKGKIFAFTPEVGSGFQGFWPVKEDIIPLCEMQVFQNLSLIKIGTGLGSVGIHSVSEISPDIYPNPGSGVFRIKGNIEQVRVLDMQGKILVVKNIFGEEIVDLSSFSTGIYLCQLIDSNQNISIKKIIITK